MIVCEDVIVKTQYDGQSMKWKLGHCRSSRTYSDYRTYVQRCCLFPGNYTLTCINSDKPDGWKKGLIQFHNATYCNDFFAFNSFRNIKIEGKIT